MSEREPVILYLCYSPYYSGAEQETLRAIFSGFGGGGLVLSNLPPSELRTAAGACGAYNRDDEFRASYARGPLWRFFLEAVIYSGTVRPNVMVASNIKGAIAAAALSALTGVPWLWYVHDYLDHRGICRKLLSALLLKRCRAIWVNSIDVGHVVREVSGRDSSLIYCGVRSPRAYAQRRQSPREAVLYVGSISAWKGLREIVEGLIALKRRAGWAPRLDVAGKVVEDEYWENVRRRAEDSGLHISYLGARNEVPDLMTGYEVVVHGTVEREPFGLVVAEAVQAGCFVVSTGKGGVREILTPLMKASCYIPADAEGFAQIFVDLDAAVTEHASRRDQHALEAERRFGVARYSREILGLLSKLVEDVDDYRRKEMI